MKDLIFMTPEGEIFHVACGFLSPENMHEEASFALQLFEGLKKELKSDERSSLVAETHRRRLEELGLANQQVGVAGMLEAMRNGNGFQGTGRTPRNGSSSRNHLMNGIGNRSFGGNNAFGNVFEGFARDQFVRDNRFSMDYPLMTHQQLERDPTRLVGREKSFFSSSSNSFGR